MWAPVCPKQREGARRRVALFLKLSSLFLHLYNVVIRPHAPDLSKVGPGTGLVSSSVGDVTLQGLE